MSEDINKWCRSCYSCKHGLATWNSRCVDCVTSFSSGPYVNWEPSDEFEPIDERAG